NKQIFVSLESRTKGAKIYYTIDDSKPDENSKEYSGLITIKKTSTIRAISFKDGYTSSKESISKYESIEKIAGVQYKYYESRWSMLPKFINLTSIKNGVVEKFTLDGTENRGTDFGLVMHGYLDVKSTELYTFFISSNDGSRLIIDQEEIINNDGAHGTIEKFGEVYLEKGKHLIELRYFQAGGGKKIKVSWQGPQFEKREISVEELK
ncbi:MAG: PA14 domain-containing protein, partial [Melioribacteraceae bacterium]